MRYKYVLVFVGGLVFLTWLFWYTVDGVQRNLINLFTVYGTYISVFGLVIAYIQLVQVKDAAQKTMIAVEENAKNISRILSVSDLSKSIKTIHEIQGFIAIKKYDLAILRMKDLRLALITVQHSQNIIENAKQNEIYSRHLTTLGIDIQALNDFVNTYKTGVNFSKVYQNLDSLEAFIGNFENEIKYKRI